MKKIIIKIVILFLLGLSLPIWSSKKSLMNVFHHKVNDQKDSIQVGKIAFYFSEEPEIDDLPQLLEEKKQKKKSVFLLRNMTIISDEAKKAVEKLNAFKNVFYAVKLERVETPKPGLQLEIIYDPNKVSFNYEKFQSISLKPGLVFRFFNKELLDKINKKESNVLTTASNSQKPLIVIDCGHGGKDTGAIGYFGIREKNICLSIGQQLFELLKKKTLLFI